MEGQSLRFMDGQDPDTVGGFGRNGFTGECFFPICQEFRYVRRRFLQIFQQLVHKGKKEGRGSRKFFQPEDFHQFQAELVERGAGQRFTFLREGLGQQVLVFACDDLFPGKFLVQDVAVVTADDIGACDGVFPVVQIAQGMDERLYAS